MALIRKKNKQTGSVSYLSMTTALLELERDSVIKPTIAEPGLIRGLIYHTYFAVYEYLD